MSKYAPTCLLQNFKDLIAKQHGRILQVKVSENSDM